MKKIWLAVFLTTTVAVVSAAAQDPVGWYINNTIYSTRVFNSMMANQMLNKSRQGKSTAAAAKAAKPKADPTIFKSNPADSIAAKLALNIGKTEADRRETEKLFNSLIEIYRKTARDDGYEPDDLAYVFGYFVVNNYGVSNDLLDVPYEKDPRIKGLSNMYDRLAAINKKKAESVRPEHEKAIYAQFKQFLGDDPELAKLTNAQKQEITEMFAITTGFNFMSYLRGVNDGNDRLVEQARESARQGLEKMLGASADRIKITYKGVEL